VPVYKSILDSLEKVEIEQARVETVYDEQDPTRVIEQKTTYEKSYEVKSGAFLEAVLPGITKVVGIVNDFLSNDVAEASRAKKQIAADEMVPMLSCLAKTQFGLSIVNEETDLSAVNEMREKLDLMIDIIVSVEPGTSYSYGLETFRAALVEGIPHVSAPDEHNFSQIADRITAIDSRHPERRIKPDVRFALDPQLIDLIVIIKKYQAEEMATLCKLLDKAGIPTAYKEDTYTGNRGNQIIDEDNFRLKSMKEIIGQFEYGGDVEYNTALGNHSDLKKVVDKCRLFVEAEDILTNTKELAQNRIQNLKEHFTTPEAVAKIEKHRRIAILDYIAAFFTFGMKGGRAKSNLVVKKEVLPEIARLNHFFKRDRSPSVPDAGSAPKRQRTNTIVLPGDEKVEEAKSVARPRSASESGVVKSHEVQEPVTLRKRGRANSA
jgi:hypothetical protein